MTPAQCRAARAFLDWSQQELANASGVGIVTVRQFEAGMGLPRNATTEALMNSLEAAGVEFLAFIKLYERNRLRSKARHADPLPQFGYAFVYHNRDGADLMYRGGRLGQVRWRNGTIEFDPPLQNAKSPALSDDLFDEWVALAEYRKATGI